MVQALFLTFFIGIIAAAQWKAIRTGLRARSAARTQPAAAEPAGSLPFVSVIVPAWRERGTIEICIRALRNVRYPAFEVILVAGGEDDTFGAARAAAGNDRRIRVIEQQPHGKNAALNAGLRFASGEVIVLLDADSQVAPTWLHAMVRPLNSEIVATTGNYYPLRKTGISLYSEMEKIVEYEIHHRVILQGSGSIALRREVFEFINCFPHGVQAAEDWDLNAQLELRGYRRAFCPDAIVYTERPASLAEWWKNELRWRRAHLNAVIRLYASTRDNVRYIAKNLLLYGMSWSLVLLAGCALLAQMLQFSEPGPLLLSLGLACLAWLGLREECLVLEVAVYRREPGWLRLLWLLPVLLALRLIASGLAVLSLHKTPVHFQGPRTRPKKA